MWTTWDTRVEDSVVLKPYMEQWEIDTYHERRADEMQDEWREEEWLAKKLELERNENAHPRRDSVQHLHK